MSFDNNDQRSPGEFKCSCASLRLEDAPPFLIDSYSEADDVGLQAAQISNNINFQCVTCYRLFSSKTFFDQHVLSHSCSRYIQCKICEKSFKTNATLKQHITAIHLTERHLKCQVCGKSFNRASSFSSHRKIHSAKVFLCSICGAGFHQKINLQRHIFVHTKEKPHICSICDRPFTQMSNLREHQKRLHGGLAEDEGHRCKICGGWFGKRYQLKSHEQKVHRLNQPEEPKSPEQPPSATSILIPGIQTPAMDVTRARGEIPFAILHLIDEVPLIVRVIEYGMYNVLKPAESSDFLEAQRGILYLEEAQNVSIAVVAMIYQKIDEHGQTYLQVTGPVSCQTESVPLTSAEESQDAIRHSLSSENMFKTLTQLNAPDNLSFVEAADKVPKLPAMPLNEIAEPQPSTSGINVLKRRNVRKITSPLPQKNPKVVITLIDELNGHVQPAKGSRIYKRNFQDIATGSLLSPVREPNREGCDSDQENIMDMEDPLDRLNIMDFIQVDDGELVELGDLHELDIVGSNEEICTQTM